MKEEGEEVRPEHEWRRGVCKWCGISEEAAEQFGWKACEKRPAEAQNGPRQQLSPEETYQILRNAQVRLKGMSTREWNWWHKKMDELEATLAPEQPSNGLRSRPAMEAGPINRSRTLGEGWMRVAVSQLAYALFGGVMLWYARKGLAQYEPGSLLLCALGLWALWSAVSRFWKNAWEPKVVLRYPPSSEDWNDKSKHQRIDELVNDLGQWLMGKPWLRPEHSRLQGLNMGSPEEYKAALVISLTDWIVSGDASVGTWLKLFTEGDVAYEGLRGPGEPRLVERVRTLGIEAGLSSVVDEFLLALSQQPVDPLVETLRRWEESADSRPWITESLDRMYNSADPPEVPREQFEARLREILEGDQGSSQAE